MSATSTPATARSASADAMAVLTTGFGGLGLSAGVGEDGEREQVERRPSLGELMSSLEGWSSSRTLFFYKTTKR